MSLKEKSVTAVIWSAVDALSKQGLSFIVSIVMARLIAPHDFGIFAMMAFFSVLATRIVDSGFATALIKNSEISEADESTVFWFNLLAGVLVCLLIYYLAPFIAHFYQEKILEDLVKIMGLNILISSMCSVHCVVLTKNFNFKLQTKIGILATGMSGIFGVYFASIGYGVWALMISTLAGSITNCLLMWLWSGWRPKFLFEFHTIRKLFGHGGYIFVSGVLDAFHSQIYTILIGRLYSPDKLGYYSRANGTKQQIVGAISTAMSRVTLPIFSEAAVECNKLNRGVVRSIKGIMLINIPVMIGIMCVADPLVTIIYGAEWSPSIEILQVLCIGGILWPLHVINLNVLIAQGHSNLYLRLEVVKKIVGVTVVFVASSFGIIGIAWSEVVFSILAFFINTHYSSKKINYSAIDQVLDFLPSLLAATAMGIVLLALKKILETSDVEKLFVCILVGPILYFSICHFFKIAAYQECLGLIRERIIK